MTEIALPPLRRSRWLRMTLTVTVAGLCLGLLAPFGSYLNSGLGWRLIYWCGSGWLGLILLLGARYVWQRLAATQEWWRRPILAALLVIVTVIQAAATRLAAFAIWPELQRHGPGWGVWFLQTGMIEAGGFAALSILRRQSTHNLPATDTTSSPLERPARASQLGKDIVALQMEDHYVRIHTSTGSWLAHMTLTEAISATEPLDGLKTHRSWWVARHAVERIEGTPRAMRLYLHGGVTAPVARGAVTLLRDAGWLETVATK